MNETDELYVLARRVRRGSTYRSSLHELTTRAA